MFPWNVLMIFPKILELKHKFTLNSLIITVAQKSICTPRKRVLGWDRRAVGQWNLQCMCGKETKLWTKV